jgi:hypothetical protein
MARAETLRTASLALALATLLQSVLVLPAAASDVDRLELMLSAPQAFLGSSVASVVERLGEPSDAATQIEKNWHDRLIPNLSITLTYDDWEIVTLYAIGVDRWFLRTIRARGAALEQLGLEVEESQAGAIERFGQPENEREGQLEFSCCPDSGVGSDHLFLDYGPAGLDSATWRYFME